MPQLLYDFNNTALFRMVLNYGVYSIHLHRSFLRFSISCRSLSSSAVVFRRKNEDIIELGQKRIRTKNGLGFTWRRKESQQKTKWTFGSVAMLAIPTFTFALGCWQVYRLQWKLNLIESLRKRLSMDAIEFPVDNLSSLEDMEYQRVRLTGEFLHDKEFKISPRGRFDSAYVQKDVASLLSDDNMSSHGAHVITPFRIKGTNLTIMVNRGWIPVNRMSRETRVTFEPHGEVSIDAIVRKSEKRPQFVQQNIPEKDIWFYKDFHQMSEKYGTEPIFVDAVIESTIPGGPIGGQTNINVKNDHLSYIITWYSLTAVTLFMWFVRFRR